MRLVMTRERGFTLIELVVVIVLLSILSVYATSRYFGSSGFSIYAAQAQAITIIQQIQLAAMQSVDSRAHLNTTSTLTTNQYQLLVTSSCLGTVQACQSNQLEQARSHALSLPQQYLFSPPLLIEFDPLGSPRQGATRIAIALEPVGKGVESTAEQVAICINKEGYVYGC